MGLYSIDRCSELGRRIEAISQDNDRAGQSLQQMKRSGAAMTGALLSLVTDDHDRSRNDYTAASASFQEALDEENSPQSASLDEKTAIAKLTEAYLAHDTKARAFLQSPDQSDAAWRTTAVRLGRHTSQFLDLVNQLATAHPKELLAGNQISAAEIDHTITSLILLMIAAVAVAIYASWRLSRGLLNPLIALTASIRQVGEGNLDQTVPVLSDDELGVLAVSFNRMAAQLKQYQATTSVELMRLNMTIRATLASFPDPIFVLNSQVTVEFRNPEADQLAVKLLLAGVTRLPRQVDEKVEHVRSTGEDYLPTLLKDAIKFNLEGEVRYFLSRIVLLRGDDREGFVVAVILDNVTRMLLLDDV